MTQTTQYEVQLLGRVNHVKKVTGWLAHNNRLFDRTCPQCKGMYSSFETTICKKCGSPLAYITFINKDGQRQAMAISEGTVVEAFTDKEEVKNANRTKSRKGGLLSIHRFKLFSFSDATGVLIPHASHHRCVSGTMVDVTIVNHKELITPYQIKNQKSRFVRKGLARVGDWVVEIMLEIFEGYGDSLVILAGPKIKGEVMVNQRVNAAGNAMPIQTPTPIKDVAPGQLEARIAALEALLPKQVNANAPAVNPPLQVAANSAEIAEALLDDYEPSFSDHDSDQDDFIDPFNV